MWAYILRRLLLIVPTLFGILLINFAVIQFAPGGPVEQMIAQIKGNAVDPAGRMTGNVGSEASSGTRAPHTAGQVSGEATSKYRGARGLDPALIKDLERQFGFDQPLHVRFGKMLWDYLRFDFGNSFFRDRNVLQLVAEKLPVSISLGLWSTLLVYLISIPLGVANDEASAAEESVNVQLLGSKQGTVLMVASAPITAGDLLQAAAAGKVATLGTGGNGTYYIVGRALNAAAADGDLVEVAHCVPVQRVVSG